MGVGCQLNWDPLNGSVDRAPDSGGGHMASIPASHTFLTSKDLVVQIVRKLSTSAHKYFENGPKFVRFFCLVLPEVMFRLLIAEGLLIGVGGMYPHPPK